MAFKELKPRPGFVRELDYPFELDGVTYTSLTFRRPGRADLEAMPAGKGGQDHLYASLAEVPPEVFPRVDLSDMAFISDWFEGVVDPNGRASRSGGS